MTHEILVYTRTSCSKKVRKIESGSCSGDYGDRGDNNNNNQVGVWGGNQGDRGDGTEGGEGEEGGEEILAGRRTDQSKEVEEVLADLKSQQRLLFTILLCGGDSLQTLLRTTPNSLSTQN